MVGGLRHSAASVEDLNAWGVRPRTVVILENKETGYAITGDLAGTVVCHGAGFSIVNYALVTWIRSAPTYRYGVGDPRREAFHLVNLSRGEPAHDTGRVRKDILACRRPARGKVHREWFARRGRVVYRSGVAADVELIRAVRAALREAAQPELAPGTDRHRRVVGLRGRASAPGR